MIPDPPAAPTAHRHGMGRAILEGLRYVAKDPPMRALVLMIAALNVGVAGQLVMASAAIECPGHDVGKGNQSHVASISTLKTRPKARARRGPGTTPACALPPARCSAPPGASTAAIAPT
jgi:hypothetical protein